MTRLKLPKYVTIEDTNLSLKLCNINNTLSYIGICYIIKSVSINEEGEMIIDCNEPFNCNIKGKRLFPTTKENFLANNSVKDKGLEDFSLLDNLISFQDMMEEIHDQPKIKPIIQSDGYVINTYEDDQGNYSPSFTTFKDAKYLKEDKVLRIVYQGDTPSKKEVFKFVREKFKKLKLGKKPSSMRVYYDEPWHFTDQGSAYGIILVIKD